MSCYNPISIRSKAIGAKSSDTMLVPCGKCVGCLKMRQDAWIYRLQREQYTTRHSFFVTLTYDEKSVPLMLLNDNDYGTIITYQDYINRKRFDDFTPTVNPRDFTLYIKRVRKAFNGKFKYYACFEYGDQFNRPHMHFVIFSNGDSLLLEKCLEDSWKKGFVEIEPLTDSRIAYVTKYINKSSLECAPNEFCLPCSQRASHGLGVIGFFDDDNQYRHTGMLETVQLNNGSLIPLPRYFRRKYYPKEDFTIEKQKENEFNRNLKEQNTFFRYCQDILVSLGSVDFEVAQTSYNENQDFARLKHNADSTRKRRKGL